MWLKPHQLKNVSVPVVFLPVVFLSPRKLVCPCRFETFNNPRLLPSDRPGKSAREVIEDLRQTIDAWRCKITAVLPPPLLGSMGDSAAERLQYIRFSQHLRLLVPKSDWFVQIAS